MSGMYPHRLLLPLLAAITLSTGCSPSESRRDRNEDAFTLQDSADWGDAASRVVNHLLAPKPPRGGIWPADENR
jgi:hypothetical protein